MATLFFDEQGIDFVTCTRPIFGPAGQVRGTHPAWLNRKKTRFLPEYIRLEVDGEGVLIWPDGHVTDLVARRHVWEKLILTDGVTRACVQGKLGYPRSCWRITPSYLPNHKSWDEAEVKAKLGPKMARYFVQGVLEFILPADHHRAHGGGAQGGPGQVSRHCGRPRGQQVHLGLGYVGLMSNQNDKSR
jgi:hypothetical protein